VAGTPWLSREEALRAAESDITVPLTFANALGSMDFLRRAPPRGMSEVSM
jgi:hypothetical protein